MKLICKLLVFISLVALSMAATEKDFADAGLRIISGKINLKLVNITISKAKSTDVPFDADTPLGRVFPTGSGRPTRRHAPRLGSTARNGWACPGPFLGAGMALSPMTFSISPPGVPTCFPILVGPPIPCICYYKCKHSFFSTQRQCSFTCGGVTVTISGNTQFSCSIKGRKIVGFPGLGMCPLSNPIDLCRA